MGRRLVFKRLSAHMNSGLLSSGAWGKSGARVLLGMALIATIVPRGEVAISQSGSGTPAQAALFTAIDLHPSGFSSSQALGTSGGDQVGYACRSDSGGCHALLWRGSAASLVDLHPSGFIESRATATSDGQQVGAGLPAGSKVPGPGVEVPYHALLWRGTANSVVDLHPKGFFMTYAQGISGGQQVGYGGHANPANDSSVDRHAMLWSGSATSVVDLNGDYTGSSEAWGVSGGSQVGSGTVPEGTFGRVHALMWHGTAASVVDLHPSGFFSSQALAISGNQQVGYGRESGFCIGPPPDFALVWRSSPGNIVTLIGGLNQTRAAATSGGEQVGNDGGWPNRHAMLWRGSADSRVDLHAFLPSGFVSSTATGISSSGDIVGYAALPGDLPSPPTHAILWKRNVKLAALPPVNKGPAPQILPPQNLMFIASDNPIRAQFVLTDPQGRRMGHDPIHNVSYREIPEAMYRIEVCEHDEETVLELRNYTPGRYTLDVFGSGNFTVKVSSWGRSRHWLTRTFDGTGAEGASSRFAFPSDVTAFAAFEAALKISRVFDAFEVSGSFTLSPGQKISPTTQDVMIEMPPVFSTTIPAGSFKQIGSAPVFKGVIRETAISAMFSLIGPSRFAFKVEGANATVMEGPKATPQFSFGGGRAAPPDRRISIGLTVGDNAGIVTVKPELLR